MAFFSQSEARVVPGSAPGALPEESALVRSCVDGDGRAFEELVRRHTSRVFNYVFQMTRHRQDAEDICQQTFIKAYRNIDRVDPDRPIIGWLLTIARRTAINHFRSAKAWTELPEDTASTETSPARQVENLERAGNLWEKARQILAPRDFEVLWLRIAEEFSVEETARVTGLTQTHVKVLVYRARQQLMKGETTA
ncbi:hypothetical protein DB347_24035 [Opitutaceae bacterium EW11]|nr:hypothetical protein DB347_24035 [Opitutaceae bacterium EW11]